MFAHLSTPLLLLAFAAAGAAVWVAGIYLANATSVLAKRFGLGQALGGLLLLAVVTNLPELAITVSAALSQHLELAIGNILGGIAMQTLVLVVLDVFGLGKKAALTYRAASLALALEGVLVLAAVLVGSQLPAAVIVARTTPAGLLILVLWVVGLWLIGKAQKGLPWQAHDAAPTGSPPPKPPAPAQPQPPASTGRTGLVFLASAVVTLVAGVVLERSGDALATHWGLSGLLFGATVLAAATSLPEVSTGLASMKAGAYELAVSDIFGGNAFLPVLFVVASALSGQAALPHAGKADLYLTGLGMLLTCVYVYGLVFRPQRQVARMGLDSLAVLALYALGMLGLLAISH
ncbi:MAG TPA: sodium:calcium antiporter [Hymenobacter sp.]|uniref:sodium:calcium antiporter n=1 Tax=Hymenobacter sp. TaxID=1898978 RepID=UPI002D80B381|nr:sodium:calcium antiporter [Hymenobacter sp.]HET9504939.1 sodium:calcium antiporter [Hymenobacter sp.]